MALSVPGGFSADDVKNGARVVVGGVVAGFAFAELWDDDVKRTVASEPGFVDEGAPSSVALTLLAVATLSMVAFAGVMLMERTPKSEAPKWKLEAAGAQVYVSVLALLTSAFYAGLKTTDAQSIGDALSERPAGLFLGLALLKLVEFGSCLALLLNPKDPLYEAVGQKLGDKGMSQRLDDKIQATKHAWVSLGFSFAITLIAAVNVDCVPELAVNSTHTYTGECDLKGLKGTSDFVWTAFISLIVVLSALFLVNGFLLGMFDLGQASGKFRYHAGFDHLSAVGAYAALSGIAMEVGRGFFQQYYTQLFVGANFWYFSALLFGFFGAVLLEGEGMIGEKRSLSQAQRSQGVLVLMAVFLGVFSTAALWGTDILFNKLEGAGAQPKGELDVYATIAVLVLSSHVVLTKIIEAFVMPELKICGVFLDTGALTRDKVEVTTKRSEATLALALASAVYFGHAEWELSLTLLFIGAAGARAVGFWHRFQEDTGNKDIGSSLGDFFYDGRATKLELGDEGVLYGGLSLIASHVLASVYVFRDGEPVPSGSATLRFWEFTAWLLLTVHVVLTLVGLITKYHAGFFPIVRFGASSIIIVVLSASLGEHALKDHLYPYIVPALLTYIMYDALSQARF